MEIQLQLLTAVTSFIGTATLKATLLIGVVFLVQKFFSRFLSPNGRYLLWWTVVISLVMPLGFDVRLPNLDFAHTTVIAESSTPAVPAASSTVVAQPDSITITNHLLPESDAVGPLAAERLSWGNLLSLLWLSGVLAVVGTMVVAGSRYLSLLRRGSPATAELQSLLRHCSQQADCRSYVRLVVSDEVQVPAVAGIIRPVLLWPAGLETQLTRKQLQHVLMHELMHVKRRDIHSACLVSLVQALHWFNPAIWIAFSHLRQDRELACDAATLRQLGAAEGKAYAQTLIHLGSSLPRAASSLPTLGILDARKQLYHRVLLLVAARPSGRLQAMLTAVLFLPLALLAFGQPVLDTQRLDTQFDNSQWENVTEPVVAPRPSAAAAIQTSQATLPQTAPAPTTNEPEALDASAPFAVPAQAPARVAESETVDLTPVADPLPAALLLAAAPEQATDTAPVENSSAAALSAPTANAATASQALRQEGTIAAAADRICIRIKWEGNHIQRICDNALQWSKFELSAGLKPGSIALAVADADPDQVFVVDRQVCRAQAAPTLIIRKYDCRSAREWAALDQDRNNQYARANYGFQNFTVEGMARVNNVMAGIW